MAENLMQVASDLKMLPDDQLQAIMANPGSPAPQFLVLGEIQQREKTRAAAQAQQQQQPTTVAQDAIAQSQGGQQMISRANMTNQMGPGYDDGGAVEGGGIQKDYGLDGSKSLAELNGRAPGSTVAAPTGVTGTNPLAGYSGIIQELAKAQSGPSTFGTGGLMGRLKAMNEDPEGYKSFITSDASKKKTHSFGMNDGGAVRPRFSPGFADGGAVGGLMPLSRDPATGKVRFGS